MPPPRGEATVEVKNPKSIPMTLICADAGETGAAGRGGVR